MKYHISHPSIPDPLLLLKESKDIYQEKLKLILGIALVPAIATILVNFFINPLAVIFSIGVSTLSQIALIYALLSPSKNTNQISDLYKMASRKFFPYLLVLIIITLVSIGGLILFIIPGIIIGVWFCFSGFILVAENKSVMESISQSRNYVKGKWWPVFWRLLFLGISGAIAGIILSIIVNILPFPSSFNRILTGAIGYLTITPFETIFFFLLYKNVKKG